MGEFEVDESYFGTQHIRSEREQGVSRETPVLGLLQRKEKVFVNGCSLLFQKKKPMSIIQWKILADQLFIPTAGKPTKTLLLTNIIITDFLSYGRVCTRKILRKQYRIFWECFPKLNRSTNEIFI